MSLQHWHGWYHIKQLLTWCILCTPYNHASCRFMQSHIHKKHACLAVTCQLHFWQNDWDLLCAIVVTWEWNRYQNKSQHRKLTLEKKTLLPLRQGFVPATFQSQVRRSYHWAIPTPNNTIIRLHPPQPFAVLVPINTCACMTWINRAQVNQSWKKYKQWTNPKMIHQKEASFQPTCNLCLVFSGIWEMTSPTHHTKLTWNDGFWRKKSGNPAKHLKECLLVILFLKDIMMSSDHLWKNPLIFLNAWIILPH